MIRKIRIFIWYIVSNLEHVLYPFNCEDRDDYYYTVKNDETGENYMIIEWIKSFDERIVRLQDEMVCVKYKILEIEKED
jgi:hypothetical protein